MGRVAGTVSMSGLPEPSDMMYQLNAFALCSQGDVRKYEDCERMVQEATAKFDKLTILVNCAAGNFLSAAEQLSSNGFRTGDSRQTG